MAFDKTLAERIREALGRRTGVTEKRMFGGVCFLLNGNMLVGVWKDSLIARLGPDRAGAALLEPHVREMDVTRRPMMGWVMVETEGLEEDECLGEWVRRARDFVETLPGKQGHSIYFP